MLKPGRDFLVKRTVETLLNGNNSDETLQTAFQFLVMARVEEAPEGPKFIID